MFKINEDHIIYEDDEIIVVDKPKDMPTQSSSKGSKADLYNELQRFLNRRDKKEVYLALHHRLDAPTRGLVLFCKKRAFNKQVTDLFREKKIIKKYIAVVDIETDIIQDSWIVENKLIQYPVKHFKRSKVSDKGKNAITEFKLIEKSEQYAIVECTPKTGRLHQIRVHLKESGLPLQGDFHYNKNYKNSDFTLIAYSLEFPHPKTNKSLHVFIDYKKIINE